MTRTSRPSQPGTVLAAGHATVRDLGAGRADLGQHRSWAGRVAAAGAVIGVSLALAACGGANSHTSTRRVAEAGTAATDGHTATSSGVGKAKLLAYLVKPQEETGFSPIGSPSYLGTAAAWSGAPARRSAETRRLIREGFRGGVDQETGSRDGVAGTTLVFLLRSPAAAETEVRAQLKAGIAEQPGGSRLRYFQVEDVPGARGFLSYGGPTPGVAANVVMSEGSCVMLVGVGTQSGLITAKAAEAATSSGARDLYRRTVHAGGVCTA